MNDQKTHDKPRMIRQGPGSLKWVPERLRVAFMPRNSRTSPEYLKGFGSRPASKTKKSAAQR